MQIDGISALVLILIASFAIDRITSALVFLFAFLRVFRDPRTVEEGPPRVRAERRQKLLYFILAGILGIGVIAGYGEVRIFEALSFDGLPDWMDSLVTGLILVAGADRIAGLLKMTGAQGAATDAQPIEITGRLVLESQDIDQPSK